MYSDKPDEKVGMKQACRIINEDINQILKGKDILGLKKLDEMLLAFQKKSHEAGVSVGDNVIRACSEALFYAYGATMSPADPYQSIYSFLRSKSYELAEKTPRLIFSVLNGGKALVSKVRFSRFYLILDVNQNDELDVTDAFLKIQA